MKSRRIRTIAVAAVVCAHALCLGLPGAFGAVYELIPDQSTVTQTNFFADINETYSITGHFGLDVDFGTGTASLGTVQATLSDGPHLETRDLAEIFRMDELVATFVAGATVTFELPLPFDLNAHEDIITISFVFDGDSVHITGERRCAALGSSYFELAAEAVRLAGVYYVDDDATGENDGSSWSNAFTHLQDALNVAAGGDEIRVAQGTYRPNDGVVGIRGERELTFQLKNGVTVKAGYAGFGEPDPDARDVELYETILSGDLSGNDEPDFVNNDENSYHIVNGAGTSSTAVLDGFIITGGNANGSSNNAVGGGMFMGDYSSPTVLNCTFRGNSAINGGGMFIEEGGASIIKNCIFSRNSAGNKGGGLFGKDECDFTLINCIFTGNMADFGGGMYNFGGDMSRQSLTNCTFYRNSANSNGGGIYNTLRSSSTLTNCIFWRNGDNSGMGVSAQIYQYKKSGSPGTPDANYSCIQGWTGALGGTGNIGADPLFVDPSGADGIAGTQDHNLRLSAYSPCIDAGDNSAVTVTTDLAGNQRIVDTVDMGAYEFQGTHLIYVDADAAGANNGQSWADAYTSLAVVLVDATYPDEIRVAQGTYRPNDGVVTTGDERELTFQLKSGVIVKGGYAGFGEPDPDKRRVDLYETILTGDLNGDDGPDFANNGDNSYHVVTGSGTNETAVLDGFTITAGNANGQGYPLYQNCGGGMFNYGYPDPNPNSPTLNNCTFRGNFAILSGGGIFNRWESSPRLTDCIFIGNSANQGGGMSSSHGSHSTLVNCIFIRNSATSDTSLGGGGMSVYDSGQTLINCLFLGNSASYGGGMDFSDNHESNMINCVFSGNSADYGGGMHSWYFCEDVHLYNCSFSKNSANYFGGAICCDEEYGTTQKMDLFNCILWGNNDSSSFGEFSQIYPSVYELSISYSDIQGGWQGLGNIDVDPLFVDPNGPDGIAGTQDDNLRLSTDSLCIDAGGNEALPEWVTTDLDGNRRIVGGIVDMGAYEFRGLLYVDDDAPGDPGPGDPQISDPCENGSKAHPFDTIQEAISRAKDEYAVTVMPGGYLEPGSGRSITFGGKNITVTGIDPADPAVVSDTVIRGFIEFDGAEDANCTLTGFRIYDLLYGAIYGNHTRATISHCIISGNGSCGATVLKDCDGLIDNCLIADNLTVAVCGVYPCIFGCDGVIKNCTIANNASGISVGDARIENCIIYGNFGSQLGVENGGTVEISYCNIQGGLGAVSGQGDVIWGPGNIDADPRFVSVGAWTVDPFAWTEGDYHLKSEGWRWSERVVHGSHWVYDYTTSPCVDAGNPGTPLGDEPMSVPDDPDNQWGVNLRVNMGAYGGTRQASMPPHDWALLADLDNDGSVNAADLALQVQDWLAEAPERPGDLNRDSLIDMKDFSYLADEWLEGVGPVQLVDLKDYWPFAVGNKWESVVIPDYGLSWEITDNWLNGHYNYVWRFTETYITIAGPIIQTAHYTYAAGYLCRTTNEFTGDFVRLYPETVRIGVPVYIPWLGGEAIPMQGPLSSVLANTGLEVSDFPLGDREDVLAFVRQAPAPVEWMVHVFARDLGPMRIGSFFGGELMIEKAFVQK